jgi:tetratricopeptide (TPR) repeat protein
LAHSSDGKSLASYGGGKSVKVRDLATNEEHSFTASSFPECVAFSRDNKLLASGNWDGSVNLWDIATGKSIFVFEGQRGAVFSLVFSPDGKTIVSGSDDATIKIWDLATMQERNTLKGHSGRVTSLAFTSNNKVLASGSADGTVKVWDAHWEAPSAQARAELTRDNQSSARGRTALEKGRWVLAIAELTEALQIDPQSSELYKFRAMAYSRKGLYEQANADYTRALELEPKSGWLHAYRAENSLQSRKFENALADCAEAFKLPGEHRHHTFFTRGCVYETQVEYEKALEDFSEAIKIHDAAHPYYHRGAVFANLGQWDRSAADYDMALQLWPENPEIWFINACLRLQIGDIERYKNLRSRMAERFGQSTNDNEIELLAHDLVLGPEAPSDRERVLQLVEQRMGKTSSVPRRIWLAHVPGLAYYRAGLYDRTIECLTKELKDHGDWEENVLNWLVLAMAHQRLKHAVEARQWFDKARQWIEQKTASEPKKVNPLAYPGWLWLDWLELKILFRKVETLMAEPA